MTSEKTKPEQNKFEFREYLQKCAKFNNIIEIKDTEILHKIHLNYRLQFFKDTVSARWLDESTNMVFINMINDNYNDIMEYIYKLENAPKQILEKLKSDFFEDKISTLKFLKEICNASKLLFSESKSIFFTNLLQQDLLSCLTDFFATSNTKSEISIQATKSDPNIQDFSDISQEFSKKHGINQLEMQQIWVAEILTFILQTLPLRVKDLILHGAGKTSGKKFMTSLFEILFNSELDGPKFEIIEFCKNLLDPESVPLKDDIFDCFYDDHIIEIKNFITNCIKSKENKECLLFLCLELFEFCAKNHGFRMRHFVTHNNVLKEFQELYFNKAKYVRMEMLKFFRALLTTKDEAICRYIVTNDLMKPILELTQKTKNKDNLIISVILELFDFIQRDNILVLIEYLMEKHTDYINTGPLSSHICIKNIKIRYEQYKDVEHSFDSQNIKPYFY